MKSDINVCDNNPCKNGGICSNDLGHFSCECIPGYIGSDCGTGCYIPCT